MPATFTVVDANDVVVDLGCFVRQTADQICTATDRQDLLNEANLPGTRLALRVTGVRVCTDFHLPAKSHTGRQLEVDTSGSTAA